VWSGIVFPCDSNQYTTLGDTVKSAAAFLTMFCHADVLCCAVQVVNSSGVLDCAFHPTQPWLFTAGADGDVLLWCN
jgi:hypothetical protein